jgi:hypothetical protein
MAGYLEDDYSVSKKVISSVTRRILRGIEQGGKAVL